jgi:hypothetical protein
VSCIHLLRWSNLPAVVRGGFAASSMVSGIVLARLSSECGSPVGSVMRMRLFLIVGLVLFSLSSTTQAVARWCPFPQDRLGCDGPCKTKTSGVLVAQEAQTPPQAQTPPAAPSTNETPAPTPTPTESDKGAKRCPCPRPCIPYVDEGGHCICRCP